MPILKVMVTRSICTEADFVLTLLLHLIYFIISTIKAISNQLIPR